MKEKLTGHGLKTAMLKPREVLMSGIGISKQCAYVLTTIFVAVSSHATDSLANSALKAKPELRLSEGTTFKSIQHRKDLNVAPKAKIIPDPSNDKSEVRKNSALIRLQKLNSFRGGDNSGGGNAVGDVLLDFYETKDLKSFDVESSPQFKLVLEKTKDIENEMPSIKVMFKKGLNKRWYLTSKMITTASCKNASAYANQTQIVGCQNESTVIIYEPWFTRPDVTLENSAGLVAHELFLANTFSVCFNGECIRDTKAGKQQAERTVRELTADLFGFDRLRPHERMQKNTAISGLYVLSAEEYASVVDIWDELVGKTLHAVCVDPENIHWSRVKNDLLIISYSAFESLVRFSARKNADDLLQMADSFIDQSTKLSTLIVKANGGNNQFERKQHLKKYLDYLNKNHIFCP